MLQNQIDHNILNNQSAVYNIDTNLQNAHGTIPYNMTNDYMFRAVLQSNNKVLRGLICSLLHLTEEDVISVEITNPIILGESVESKEFRLDINVLLNDNTLINLEMQVANRLNWHKRSVMYLCRSFDSLTLNVVDLSCIDLATEEDRQHHIDYWATLFKATTWEEVKMLASKNEYLNEAAKTIYQMSADKRIRKQCRDREEYYEDLRSYERAIAKRDQTIAEKDIQIQQLLNEIEKLKMQRQN